MIYTRTELIFAVLLVASFFIEGSQADLRVRASTEKLVSSATSSTSPSASATSMFTFHPLPTPTSCASAIFSWTYSGTDGPMSLQVTNIGVSQNSPPSTTISSIATTRDLLASSIPSRSVSSSPPRVNMTIAIDYEPSTQSFVWTSVNVSQGWYILTAIIPIGDVSQNSSPFFVFTETNTSCLVDVSSTTSTSTSAPLPSPSDPYGFNASQPNVTPAPASELSSQSKSKVPTIVGVTVGMAVLVIGIILGLALRRARSRAINGNSKSNRWNGWNFTDSRGLGANANITRFQLSRSRLTSQPGSVATMIGPDSEDDKILGAEKSGTHLDLKVLNLSEDQGLALSNFPVLPRMKPDQTYSASSSTSNLNDFGLPGNKSPSARHSARPSISISSTVYPPSFGIPSRESPQNVVGSYITNTTGAPFFFDQASASPSPNSPRSSQFPSAQTTHASSEAKQLHRQSSTRKRKPVPLYDASEEDSPVSTNSPLATFPVTGESELSQKNSFGPGGIEGKQLHYLIPDMPMAT